MLLISYDADAKKWFVVSYSTRGHFIVSESASGPNDVKQKWVNIYPVDPNAEQGTFIMRDTSYETFDAYKDNGNRVILHTSCAKH